MYDAAGYSRPGANDLSKAQAVRDAKDALTNANISEAQAEQSVQTAQAALAQGVAVPNPPLAAAYPTEAPASGSAATLPTAQAGQPDLTSLQQNVDTTKQALVVAQQAVVRAQATLNDAQQAAWPTLPSGEVVFVDGLPRRVDTVTVALGQAISSNSQQAALTISGANINIVAHVPKTQAGAVTVGAAATITDTVGDDVSASVVAMCGDTVIAATCDVQLTLSDPGGVNRDALVGNVRVAITVGTSSPNSLVVPVAAVSADASGHPQVQLVTGTLMHDKPASEQPTMMVLVEVGLSADGYVEIRSADGTVQAGDLVVIGTGTAPSAPTSASTGG
jgi:hypothetical protein